MGSSYSAMFDRVAENVPVNLEKLEVCESGLCHNFSTNVLITHVQKLICSALVPAAPDFDKPVETQVDGGKIGAGAVLLQVGKVLNILNVHDIDVTKTLLVGVLEGWCISANRFGSVGFLIVLN